MLFSKQTLVDESRVTLPQTEKNTTHKLGPIIVTPEEVRDTLKSLPIGKAAGTNLINNRLLKELAQPLALPLSGLFNFSLSSGNRLMLHQSIRKMTHLMCPSTGQSLF